MNTVIIVIIITPIIKDNSVMGVRIITPAIDMYNNNNDDNNNSTSKLH